MFLAEPQNTPYDLRWRMFGIPVRVQPFFWIIAALLTWSPLIGYGLPWVLLGIGCVFLSILLHEMGHVLMGRLFGSWGYIVLYGMGGLAVGSNDLQKRWQRILVSFAGPLAQLLLFAGLMGMLFLRPINLPPTERGFPHPLETVIEILLYINLIWPLLNLLPIWPLDGGQICRELCEGLMRQRGLVVSLQISLGVSVLLLLQSIAAYAGRGLPIPFMTGQSMFRIIFFGIFAVQSYQYLMAANQRFSRYDEDDY